MGMKRKAISYHLDPLVLYNGLLGRPHGNFVYCNANSLLANEREEGGGVAKGLEFARYI